jgi:hypothetical protein
MSTNRIPHPAAEITSAGFAFVEAPRTCAMLAKVGRLDDWPTFAASWDRLEPDTFMADGGRYRRRRHGVFRVDKGGRLAREPHQAHWQGRDFNPLNGGIERWFAPIEEEFGRSVSLSTIIAWCERCFGACAPATMSWRVEVHQFRIEARSDMVGLPTPEGMHRDGVDYVLVLLIDRTNIASGTTTIADLEGRALGSFTLGAAFDAALVEDGRVQHGVTPVEPVDPRCPAHRDVLVVTFRKLGQDHAGHRQE